MRRIEAAVPPAPRESDAALVKPAKYIAKGAFPIARLPTNGFIGWYRIHDSVFDTLHTLQVDDDGVYNEVCDKEKEP